MQTLESINVGQAPNDGKGEPHRDAFQKINANFDKVVEGVGEVGTAAETAAQAAQSAAQAAQSAGQAAQAAGEVAAAAISETEKGAAGGVAPLDSDGKLPEGYLPAVFIPKDEKGAAGGVATLGTDGKVTPQQLPNAVDAIPMSQKGVASGVASLDANSRILQQIGYAETIFAGINANDVVLPGLYVIQSDANATAALNWPILLAGTMIVEVTSAGNGQATQTYTTRTGRTFKRVRFSTAGWSGWQEMALLSDVSSLLAPLTAQMAQTFGVGQSWQNVGGSRAPDINYTNSTGRPILMSVTVLLSGANGRCICYVDNRVSQDAFNPSAGATLGGMVVVPAGSVGRIVPVAASISSWWEYR